MSRRAETGREETRLRRVMLLGGTSEIGLAIVAALLARGGRTVSLVGRDRGALERAAQTLRAEGAERVLSAELDATALDAHAEVLRGADEALGGTDLAIVAVGVLGAEGGRSDDVADGVRVLATNVVGAGSLLLHVAELMRRRGGGTIVVLSSVAATRPRRSNAVYGASKAGLDALAEGLSDRLHGSGVRIVVVRPGFVRTRMTEGMKPAPFAVSATAVAEKVVQALDTGRGTVWVPSLMGPVALLLRLLPRPLWRRIEL